MDLEIKGFIEFCRSLSNHPEAIMRNEELVETLDFCFNAFSQCKCSSESSSSALYEDLYFKQINKLSKETLQELGQILDKQNTYSSIVLSFANNNDQIIILK
jgi:hypothetical protein